MTTFKSWQELGAWYANLERERRIPDASVKAEADMLVKGKTDDMAKVKALYDYVSRNIRYVSLSFGLGRIQPHAASEVLANGYGDCKDKNTLLAALLEAEGFHSTSVLIGSKLKLDPDVPSPWQFDHVITRVPVDGKEIWLDSTPGVAPFRMLSVNLRDKQALAIPPDGTPELVCTPADLPFEGFERITLEGSVNDTGKLALHFDMTERGDREMVMRYVMRSKPSNRWKDLFENMLQRTGIKGAEVTDLKTSDPGATDDPLHVEFNFTANNYFDWSAPESRFRLPLSMISVPAADEDDDSASKEPIKLNAIEQVVGEVKLTFPPKYTVHAPIGVDVKRDYAEYHSVYKYEAGQLTGKRTLNVLAREVPRERTQDYLAFRRVLISDQSQEARLENQSPSAAGMSSESADDLFSAAVKAGVNGKYQLAVDLLQKVVKLEPKHKEAWDSLGRAYFDLGETDKAIEAIKTQIGINPYSQRAYNNLGFAYERQGKYDEASAQFQKQTRDQSARCNCSRKPGPPLRQTEEVCGRRCRVGESSRSATQGAVAVGFPGAGLPGKQSNRQRNGRLREGHRPLSAPRGVEQYRVCVGRTECAARPRQPVCGCGHQCARDAIAGRDSRGPEQAGPGRYRLAV